MYVKAVRCHWDLFFVCGFGFGWGLCLVLVRYRFSSHVNWLDDVVAGTIKILGLARIV